MVALVARINAQPEVVAIFCTAIAQPEEQTMAHWSFKTTCKYHTQNEFNYCGAASAMMVLAEIGVAYSQLNQPTLFNQIQSNNLNKSGLWASDPIGLQTTLVNLKPAAFGNTFVVNKAMSEQAGSRKLVHALRQFGVSAIAMVYPIAHWIVVCGVQTDIDPVSGKYAILGFWVNDPLEEKRTHAGADVCGTHGHGKTHQWVHYSDWKTSYFTGNVYDSPNGAKQYISVCDPAVPTIAMPSQIEPAPYFDGVSLVPIDSVINVLKRELDLYSLATDDRMIEFASGTYGTPILVRRLDRDRGFYYLSPSMQGNAVLGFGQTDALFGNIQSVITFEKGATIFELDRNSVIQSLIGLSIELPSKRVFQLIENEFAVDPELVWQPCLQSVSPHLPFWRITSGSYTFYRRLDGQMFAELTFTPLGM
jgi:hypothetical protein